MEAIKKTNQFPDWVDSFVYAFGNSNFNEIEHEAELNVKALPRVVWNDNTFYVSLDKNESCADVFNEYGNVVTALKNVSSIEDVEKSLNKKIVADTTEATNTIKKESSSNSSSLDDMLLQMAKQLGLDPNATIQDVTKVAEKQIQEDKKDNKVLLAQVESLSKQNVKINKELKQYKKNFTKLAESLNQLSNIVSQIYARINPGNVYDINATEAEVKHFNETANQSLVAINVEHQTDLTTSNGRASLRDKLLNDLDNLNIEEEDKTTTQPSNIEVNVQINTDNTNSTDKENVQPVELVDSSIIEEEIIDEELDSKDNVRQLDNNQLDTPSEPQVLKTKEASMFKKQICPICHNKTLRLKDITASVQNVICNNCHQLYGVNLDNEEIFKK